MKYGVYFMEDKDPVIIINCKGRVGLKEAIKAKAASLKITMSKYILSLVEENLEKNKNPNIKNYFINNEDNNNDSLVNSLVNSLIDDSILEYLDKIAKQEAISLKLVVNTLLGAQIQQHFKSLNTATKKALITKIETAKGSDIFNGIIED